MDLYVHESGSWTAPAIVFLHGGGLSGRIWQPQFERLPDYYCLAPDLPEQGRSADIQPFVLEDAAGRVIALIHDRIPAERAHLVGLSLGGAVALTVLRMAPDTVDHVMVSGTSTRLGPVLRAVMLSGGLMYRLVSEDKLICSAVKQFGIPEPYQEMFREDMLLTENAAFNRHVTDALADLELPTRATAPTLVVVGEQETWPARRAARKLVAAIDGAQGVTVPRVGHVWNLQAPDLFADVMRRWVSDEELPQVLRPLSQ